MQRSNDAAQKDAQTKTSTEECWLGNSGRPGSSKAHLISHLQTADLQRLQSQMQDVLLSPRSFSLLQFPASLPKMRMRSRPHTRSSSLLRENSSCLADFSVAFVYTMKNLHSASTILQYHTNHNICETTISTTATQQHRHLTYHTNPFPTANINMKLSTAAAAININIISSTLVHASASSVRSMQASILTGKSRKDAKTSKSAKTKAAKNMSYSSSLEQPCNGGTPNAGTTCVKQTANGCELQVGPDPFPTKIDSQQQGHVVITNDGSSVEVSGSIYGGCNVAAVQYKDTFDPPSNCSPPNPGASGAWMSLWFGAVGVSNSNIKSFNATIVDPIIPDFMGDGSVSVSYRQWGVAAQPAALVSFILIIS